ncbi:MAG: hypothetical protein E6H07_13865 [Bacteroidetes bacterium]|nr:MAG: hypothetical protein E6H07_13865 [Bacteroidota bacterium]
MFAKLLSKILPVIVLALGLNTSACAQVNPEEFNELKRKVVSLESDNSSLKIQLDNFNNNFKTNDYAPMGLVLFLFGCFCALWAQNRGNNPWVWFFLGLFFSVITVVFVLIQNAKDINENR